MTDSSSTCPDCGTTLPHDSPQQLCPTCLLKQAFVSRTVDGADAPTQGIPPSPKDIANKFPQFEITECLGRGGMGVVYKARQKSLNRWVAIKILAPERIGDEKFAERFTTEAHTLAQLSHPNIVTVHDYGETEGLYYIVMEFIDGVNLRDLIQDGKMEPAQALTIIPPICEALQYAHDKGIVHRDIKPENLLLDREGRVKIADFGIASLVGASGELSGTPPYMAPEQGQHANVDHRADIYALGAVLYEMLTGERPDSPLDVPSQRVQVDVRIDDIVLRALSKEPERRYRSANEFQTVVETVVDHPSPATATPAIQEPPALQTAPSDAGKKTTKKGLFRRWWWVFLITVLMGPFLGIAGYVFVGALMPRIYESTTIIQVRSTDREFDSQAPFQKHFDQITSTESLKQTSLELALPERWAVSTSTTVERLRESIHLQNRSGTDLIEIRVRSNPGYLSAKIANKLASIHASSFPGGEVAILEMATRPRSHIGPSRRGLVLAAPAGLVLSPLLGLLLATLLHWIFPEKLPEKENTDRKRSQGKPFFSHLALGLILVGILGTLAMLPFARKDDYVLMFGTAAVSLGLLFGLFSPWSRAIRILLVIGAIIGLLVGVAATLIYSWQTASLQREAEARLAEAISEQKAAISMHLGFQPEHEMTIPYPRSGSRTGFLDLDSRTFLEGDAIHSLTQNRFGSTGSEPANADQKIEEWASSHGADLMTLQIKPELQVAFYGGPMTLQPFLDYDTATAAQVLEAAAELPQSPPSGTGPPQVTLIGPDPGETLVFRTREGGIGLLELRESPEFPKGGLIVRYKTVTNTP